MHSRPALHDVDHSWPQEAWLEWMLEAKTHGEYLKLDLPWLWLEWKDFS